MPLSYSTKLFSKGITVLSMVCIALELSGLTHINNASSEPVVVDPNLKMETYVGGLDYPTSVAFLGVDDILVLEKNTGQVRRIVNGTLLPEPLVDLNVANAWERGLLGISIAEADYNNHSDGVRGDIYNANKMYDVFLYFTKKELMSGDGGDRCPRPNACESNVPVYGYLYRYEFRDDKLVNPKLLLKTPAAPGADHNGGTILIGDDNNVYVAIGDGDSCDAGTCIENFKNSVLNSTRSNFKNGTEPDGRGGILRITQDGKTVREEGTVVEKEVAENQEEGILGNTHPLNKYYAYGIRNSFGMDFDPVTGKLWDTENGPGYGDEINLVEPGFNSGWAKKQGVWSVSDHIAPLLLKGFFYNNLSSTEKAAEHDTLVNFSGKDRYSAPEFTWRTTVAPTALRFYDSDILGDQYKNDMFVADYNNGNIYHFELDKNRTALDLVGSLEDKVANSSKEYEDIIFAQGFGEGITDIEVGPHDGYLYLVSHVEGKLYRITPVAKD